MSKTAAVTTTALGVVTPWSAPVRLLAARGLLSARRRRAAQSASTPSPLPRRSRGKGHSRLRAVVVLGAIGGVVAAGAVVAVRARTTTPPPVAPAPPRVEDVPTADATGPQSTSE